MGTQVMYIGKQYKGTQNTSMYYGEKYTVVGKFKADSTPTLEWSAEHLAAG